MKLHWNKVLVFIRERPKPIIVIAICCVALFAASLWNSTGIADPRVPLAANLKSMKAGETIAVKIYAKQVSDLYGYQFKLNFDESALEYQSLRSSIPEITLIFQKPFTGYLLVGATKVGDEAGYTATADTQICEVVLRAAKDGVIPNLSLSEVNVIDSVMDYEEDVQDWSFELEYAA